MLGRIIPEFPWPPPDEEVRAALAAAWADGSWGRYDGPHNERLAAALQDLMKTELVYPCCSGTFAVELALRMLKVGGSDEVILAGYDFGGNFRAIESVGATPVLVDIVPRRWHLDPSQLAAAASPKVKAVIVSHLHGVLAPMQMITEIAKQQGWAVVEDACQVPGAVVDGRPAGSWGDVGVLSFGGSKLLTAGRGGAVVTSDATLHHRAKLYCEPGNHAFPLSELQAAVLLPQIARLAARNAQRRRAVERIHAVWTNRGGKDLAAIQMGADATEFDQTAYYKLGWLIELADDSGHHKTEACRAELGRKLRAAGIAMDDGFRGFARRGSSRCRRVGELAHAQRAASGTILLHHPVLLAPDDVLDTLANTILAAAQSTLPGTTP